MRNNMHDDEAVGGIVRSKAPQKKAKDRCPANSDISEFGGHCLGGAHTTTWDTH